jgi:hypothetical protein
VGLRRTVAREHPEFRVRLVDLDPSAGAEPAAALANILRGADGDLPPEQALRGERCFVPRLEALGSNLSLRCWNCGHDARILDGLKLVPSDRRAPAPGEVEVAMAAAGLNFRDVMAALDMLPARSARRRICRRACCARRGRERSGAWRPRRRHRL